VLALFQRCVATPLLAPAGYLLALGFQLSEPAQASGLHRRNRPRHAFGRGRSGGTAAVQTATLFAAHRPIPTPARRAEVLHEPPLALRTIQRGVSSSPSGIAALESLFRHGVGRVSVFELIGGLHVLVRGVDLGGRCVRIWSLRLGSHHGRNGDVDHGVTTRTSIGYRFSSSLNIREIGRESLGNWLLTGWSLVRIRPGEPNKIKWLNLNSGAKNQRKIRWGQHSGQQRAYFAAPAEPAHALASPRRWGRAHRRASYGGRRKRALGPRA
jgi:hypothetical protein